MKKQILTLVLITLIIGISVVSCSDNKKIESQKKVPSFNVLSAVKSNITVYNEYAANIEGEQNIEIRPKVDGFIEKIYIDEGDEVKTGQLLFKLSVETLQQQVKQAKATIEMAKAQVITAQVNVDKIRPLVEKNIISPIQLKTAESNLNAMQAQLNAARASYLNAKENLGYSIIKSPVDGIVGSIPYKMGSLVGRSESEPLTTVSNIKNVYAYFSLNEKQLLQFTRQLKGASIASKIKELPEVELILSDGSTYEAKGSIETINGMVNPRTGSISYRAKFPNSKKLLRSGISGKVKFPSDLENIYIIPQDATFEMQGKKFVYLVNKENKVQAKEIKVSNTYNNKFVIKNGLENGQLFVTEGLIKLKEGMKISPKLNELKGGIAQLSEKELSGK